MFLEGVEERERGEGEESGGGLRFTWVLCDFKWSLFLRRNVNDEV